MVNNTDRNIAHQGGDVDVEHDGIDHQPTGFDITAQLPPGPWKLSQQPQQKTQEQTSSNHQLIDQASDDMDIEQQSEEQNQSNDDQSNMHVAPDVPNDAPVQITQQNDETTTDQIESSEPTSHENSSAAVSDNLLKIECVENQNVTANNDRQIDTEKLAEKSFDADRQVVEQNRTDRQIEVQEKVDRNVVEQYSHNGQAVDQHTTDKHFINSTSLTPPPDAGRGTGSLMSASVDEHKRPSHWSDSSGQRPMSQSKWSSAPPNPSEDRILYGQKCMYKQLDLNGYKPGDPKHPFRIIVENLPPGVMEKDLWNFVEDSLWRNSIIYVKMEDRGRAHISMANYDAMEKLIQSPQRDINGSMVIFRRPYPSDDPVTISSNDSHHPQRRFRSPGREYNRSQNRRGRGSRGLVDNSVEVPPDCKLFLGDVYPPITEDDLVSAFERYGRIKRVTIVKDKNTDKCKGYAFIYYDTPDGPVNAMAAHRFVQLGPRNTTVELKPFTGLQRDQKRAERRGEQVQRHRPAPPPESYHMHSHPEREMQRSADSGYDRNRPSSYSRVSLDRGDYRGRERSYPPPQANYHNPPPTYCGSRDPFTGPQGPYDDRQNRGWNQDPRDVPPIQNWQQMAGPPPSSHPPPYAPPPPYQYASPPPSAPADYHRIEDQRYNDYYQAPPPSNYYNQIPHHNYHPSSDKPPPWGGNHDGQPPSHGQQQPRYYPPAGPPQNPDFAPPQDGRASSVPQQIHQNSWNVSSDRRNVDQYGSGSDTRDSAPPWAK